MTSRGPLGGSSSDTHPVAPIAAPVTGADRGVPEGPAWSRSATASGPAGNPGVVVRRARTSDVPEIKRLVDEYAGRILLEKNLVTLYESVQEFWVAELDGRVVGCGALHVLWADLGEVRTVAVDPVVKGRGVGGAVVDRLVTVARELELRRVFVLTFEVDFFGRHGFVEIDGTPVTAEVYAEMCRSYDTGVAEFLDLSYVKPNTLGNTRMLLTL
ncbi:amino-acid N-acetyltransferase [Nocardia rhizosphaerae]|uniref:Amino-acid N-acetyltransferase n=1 Tax=Nocardia rhizosphaerae TaxID=1691571 RepID=A0ABV8L881_9NOCA